jgi:WASH complex subunit 7
LQAIANEPRRVVFIAEAMNDIADLVEKRPDLTEKFDNFFTKMIRDTFINPVFEEIEKELRFHSHSHLSVSERNPLKARFASFDKFLSVTPFRVFSRMIDIKFEASYHFSSLFYKETAVAPQVWETYAEMANLAHRLYGIEVLDCHIPGAMMQQEIDVLEIMRHINMFVACYNYDLNSQVFVQRAEDSPQVTVVGIPHVFSSYRCHGIGIMNTTVDFTYRFLRLKFNVFSKFLFDDHVKSRLLNDIGWFEQHKRECNGMWPFARAEKLVEDMKRIGMGADGKSVLDHFRVLITEIGNALGFVRMVKSGGGRFLNNAIGFVYDEDAALCFFSFAEEVQLSDATMEATKRLDSVVGKLKELFNSSDSFFKLLVDVFSEAFRDKRNEHLRNFYAIIPALTLAYLEHIARLKDNAAKQNKNSSFSDDGFPMGLAYVLKLLGQDAIFDSIHWFKSLRFHSDQEKKEAEANPKATEKWKVRAAGADKKQTMKLALAMIERERREFLLLETTLHSARILFN